MQHGQNRRWYVILPSALNAYSFPSLSLPHPQFLPFDANQHAIATDMFQVSAPSWSACMDSCAQYNLFHDGLQSLGDMPSCAGISYVPEWSVHPEYAYSNYTTRGSCWLKSDMSGLPGNWPFYAEVVSALRVQ